MPETVTECPGSAESTTYTARGRASASRAISGRRGVALAGVLVAVLVLAVFSFGFAGAVTTVDDGEALVASNPADEDEGSATHVVTIQIGEDDAVAGETLAPDSEIVVDYGEDGAAVGEMGAGEYISPDGTDVQQLEFVDVAPVGSGFVFELAEPTVTLEEGGTLRLLLVDSVDNAAADADGTTVDIDIEGGPSQQYDAAFPLGDDAGIAVDAPGVDEEWFTSLQQAVDAVGDADDATISLGPGTFNELNAQPTLLSANDGELEPVEVDPEAADLTIEGAGPGQTTVLSEAIGGTILDGGSAAGLEVRDIAFEGDGRVQQADTALANVETVGTGVEISGVDTGILASVVSTTVVDVTLTDIGSTAIDVTSDTSIDDITVVNSNAAEGIRVADGTSILSLDQNGGASTIEGVDRGVFVEVAESISISNTQFDDVQSDAIRIEGLTNPDIPPSIEDVTVQNSEGANAIALIGTGYPVENLNIGSSTAPDTTLSFEGGNVLVGATQDPPADPDGEIGIGRYFEAVSTNGGQLTDLELAYESGDVEGVDEETLSLWRYDTGDGAWVEVDGSGVDTGANVVTADEITEFSTFGAFGESAAQFDVEITDIAEPVIEQGMLELDATVTNEGEATDTQDVTLSIAPEGDERFEIDSQTVSELGPGDSTDVTFAVDLDEDLEGDVLRGEWDLEVATADDEDFETITIWADFQVEITDWDDSVSEGETVEVTATITDAMGGEVSSQEQSITLDVAGEQQDSTVVSLGGTSEEVVLEWNTEGVEAGEYSAEVASMADSDTAPVAVEPPPGEAALSNIDIAGQGDDATIGEGEDEVISVDVTNVGGQEDDFEVDLRIIIGETLVVDETTTVENLGADQTETVTFDGVTNNLTSNSYWVQTRTDDGSLSGDLLVIPFRLEALDIAGQGDDATITEGEDEDVTVDVVAVDDISETEIDVTLQLGEGVEETERVVLGPDNMEETVTFEGVTGDLEPDEYDAEVVAELLHPNGSNPTLDIEGNLTVEEAPSPPESELSNLAIAGQGSFAFILEGEDADVSVDVENIGDETGTFDVELVIGDDPESPIVEASKTVENLEGGATETVTFEGVTGDLDALTGPEAAPYSVDVTTADDLESGSLFVEPVPFDLANLDIAGQGDDATISQGEERSVTVDVVAVDDISETEIEVALTIGNVIEETETVTLDFATPEQTVTFERVTGNLFAGQYDVEVTAEPISMVTPDAAGAEDSDIVVTTTGDLTVTGGEDRQSPAESALSNLDIAGQGSDAEITEGDDGSVSVDVTNVGEEEDSFGVTLTIGDELEVSTTTGVLDDGESETVTFEGVTGDLEPGEYTVSVSSDDDHLSGSVDVTEDEDDREDEREDDDPGEAPEPEGAEFAVEITTTNSPVVEGESVEVTAQVENVGDETGTESIVLRVASTQQDDETVTLDGGESTEITLTWATESGDTGDHTVEVSSPDDVATADVTVTEAEVSPEPATFVVTIEELVESETEENLIEATASITNTGEVADTQMITLTVDGTELDSQELTLDAGETQTITFEWTLDEDDIDEVTVEIASQDEFDTDVTGFEGDDDDGLGATGWGLLALLLALALILSVYYYVRRRGS